MADKTNGSPITKTASSKTDSTQASSASVSSPTIETTQPDAILRHDISDGELDRLTMGGRSWMDEAVWGCIGLASASLMPAMAALIDRYGDSGNPISALDQIQIVLLVVGVTGAIAFGLAAHGRKTQTERLADDIRSRRRYRVGK